MLEPTDYKIEYPAKASVGSPCHFKVTVPAVRGVNTGGTEFKFTDGAGGKFKPKKVLLQEGEGEFTFVYKPTKQGNNVVTIKSSDDVGSPAYKTITVTQARVGVVQVEEDRQYAVRIHNPQAMYTTSDQPYTDDLGSITGQHIVDKTTVEIHGLVKGADDYDSIEFTDNITPGAHVFTLPVIENQTPPQPEPPEEVITEKSHTLVTDETGAESDSIPTEGGVTPPDLGLQPRTHLDQRGAPAVGGSEENIDPVEQPNMNDVPEPNQKLAPGESTIIEQPGEPRETVDDGSGGTV